MSYRTRINDFQIFENNGYSEELIAELNRQGANISEDDDCYKFEIKDITPIIKIVDDYYKEKINEMIRRWQNPYDLTFFGSIGNEKRPLYDRVDSCVYSHILFQSYNLIQFLYRNKMIKRNEDGTYTMLKKIVVRAG